ncbi:hypothetical protein, variant 3 [Saprolegnia diclina VS20]|uniref:Uncharacterized protein n=1 Tax=Saprolegnia diclina (strain VS20) TaxID=1156394 RepID=T0QXH0_SAPDV|nr:hypothetical protein, variant 3 [Saprolegnia diclina VS20]EQC38760.1 hypothetical protein, variant 3 [Saprolegnia diclina VS20]|eukprot:XP_008607582.1 hypothetical protein, variant 3 [Saprolegnia diclina VS20]
MRQVRVRHHLGECRQRKPGASGRDQGPAALARVPHTTRRQGRSDAPLREVYRQKEATLLLEITTLRAALSASTEANETQVREFQAQKVVIEQSFRDRIEAVDTKYVNQAFSPKALKTPAVQLTYDPALGANYCPLPPRNRGGSSAMIKELLTSGAADTSGDAAIMTSILANAQKHSQRTLCLREE